MIKFIKLLFVVILLGFIFTQKVLAVNLDVSNIPATISASPFAITVSIFGANTGKNYLRVDLFKEGTFNYFGETNNGGEWYAGSTGTSYFPIDIVSSSATATADVQAQIGAPSDTDYLGSGLYKLRIRRYTSASSYSAGNPYDIYINVPTPTPTEAPEPIQTTATPTSTPIPTPTKIPVPTSTKTPTPAPTKEPDPTESPVILGIEDEPSTTPPSFNSDIVDPQKKSPILAIVFIGLGLILICFSVGYTIRKTNKDEK